MIVLGILDDRVGNDLPVAEYRLVVEIRGEVAVHHLRVISYTNLREESYV